MDWKNEYTWEDRTIEVELRVYCPNDGKWFWSAWDVETEDGCVSNLPGFDTKEAAQQAAKDWYEGTWLPRFQATGERIID